MCVQSFCAFAPTSTTSIRSRTLSHARIRNSARASLISAFLYGKRRALHRKKAMNVVGVHVGAVAFGDDFAARHDDVAIGERFRKIVVLLDEQDRHLAA